MQRKSSSSGDSPVAKGKRHAPPRFEPRRGMKLLLGLLGLAILTSALTFSSTLSALLDRPVPTFEVEQRESAPAPTSLRGEQEEKKEEEEKKPVEDKRHRAPTDECYVATDYGALDGLAKSPKTYCSSAEAVAAAEANNKLLTSYTVYDFGRANLQATVFRKLRIDMNNAKVVRDISSIAEDGGAHDPRYWFTSVRPLCACEKGVPAQDSDHKAPRVWNERFVNDIFWRTGEKPTDHEPTDKDKMHRVCERPTNDDKPTYSIGKQVQVLLVSRFNDHNPFFQISQTLNTWIMMKVLGWSNLDTQIVYIDKGLPAAVDELRHKMLAPLRPAMLVSDMMHQNSDPSAHMGIIELDTALVTPYEWTGPIMRHLDNYEPCARSKLIADFRSAAFQAMGVSEDKVNASSCIATIISRRDYGGRKLQRVWRNEQEVLDRMIADLGDRCTFQAVDFIELSFAEQMRTIVNSDIVIGMHGAGMGNVIWTRPGALVIEIFPKTRRRWGFRNICQEVGSEWHEFRGGEDVSKNKDEEHPDPNKLDKSIPPDEWAQFANPLLRAAIDRAKYGYR